jgi:hypothetical protein
VSGWTVNGLAPVKKEYDLPTGGSDLDAELRAMSDDELQQLKLDLQEEISSIKGQLIEARARVHVTGQYSDSDWYRRANGAQRVKGNQYNAACAEQGRRRRELADKRRASLGENPFERAFVKAARELLSEDRFAYISRRAWEIADEAAAAMGSEP